MLLIRIISALAGIPIVIASVYFGGPWYALFLLLVLNLGAYEYNNLLRNKGYNSPAFFSFLGVSLFIIVLYFERLDLIYPLIMILLLFLFISALFKMEKISLADSAFSLWGVIYIGGMGGYLLLLRLLPDGAMYTYLMLAGVWIHDSLAYFIGVKWGFRKFAPRISPNKSVEGSLAGILGTVSLLFAVSILFPSLIPLRPGQAIIFALGIAVFAQLGDLMESALKRQLKVKDSGAIIPGHGGILDRFDSLLLTAPFVYYFFLLLNLP
jgi:phosphatidate cytidylyltransferase